MNFTKMLTFAIIAMFLLVPFASAKQEVADSVKQDKINEKVTDKTKESVKEITNKNKDIKGKVTVTDSDSSKYTVEKKSKTEIRIAKDEAKGEHTKSKVAFAKEDLKSIDVDGDQLYGVLHISEDGSTTHDVYTESQLIAGTEMLFTENIVSGYSGYTEQTFTSVTSGTTLNTPDVSSNDYYITTSIDGAIPTTTAVTPTFPSGAVLWMPMNNATNLITGSVGTTTSVTFANGSATFNGVSSKIIMPGRSTLNMSTKLTMVSKFSTTNATRSQPIISMGQYLGAPGLFSYALGIHATDGFLSYGSNGTTSIFSQKSTPVVSNTKYFIASTWNGSSGSRSKLYKNSALIYNASSLVRTLNQLNTNISIGYSNSLYFGGSIDTLALYNRDLSASELMAVYSGQTGISVRPIPSYNFTPYNVASGVEKIIDTDAMCTGLEYVDTTGGTHTVTVRIYFTEDITKTTETKGAVYQNVSIIHTKQNASASVGTIAYELDPLYSGTPALTSNNTNATVSRNDTHVLISTGLVKQGQSFSYVVSVADDHDHGIHINKLMKWVGTGWDFVSTAPDDWDDYIGDQIEVTVS